MTVNSGNIIILIIIILTLDLSAQDEITPTVKLEGKWKIDLNFSDEFDGKKYQIDSTMVSKGIDQTYTAMAKTVGLPVAIAALKILNGEIKSKGVQIPIKSSIYKSILKELENYGIIFKEKSTNYLGYNILNS